MTAQELIKKLLTVPEDTLVFTAYGKVIKTSYTKSRDKLPGILVIFTEED